MFPEDYELSSGRPEDVVLKCSSPELDADSVSGRTTPEGMPALGDIQLVKYVKWNVPTDDGGPVDPEGRSRRRAVAREILPDSETIRMKKSLSSHRRRHSRKSSFEIGSAVEQGPALTSDSEMEDKSKWRPSPACSPLSNDSTPDKPEIESIPAISELYRGSFSFTSGTSSGGGGGGAKGRDTENVHLNHRGGQSHRSKASGKSSTRTHRKGCHRISDIAEKLHPRSARSSTDNAALKILGSSNLNAAANYDTSKSFEREREFILSPLPSTSQLRVAKAAHHSYDTDSQSAVSSLEESGYSDMIGVCPTGEMDCWAREAAENPYSVCDEIQPRFGWLRKSVAPVTALAGALLVSLASMSSTVLDS